MKRVTECPACPEPRKIPALGDCILYEGRVYIRIETDRNSYGGWSFDFYCATLEPKNENDNGKVIGFRMSGGLFASWRPINVALCIQD